MIRLMNGRMDNRQMKTEWRNEWKMDMNKKMRGLIGGHKGKKERIEDGCMKQRVDEKKKRKGWKGSVRRRKEGSWVKWMESDSGRMD